MDYLREFPATIRPTLEAIVVQADLDHRLTGHFGGLSARGAALRYFTDTYCRLAAELCQAVEAGSFAYLDLSPSLERLRHALVRDVYGRAELSHWAESEVGYERRTALWLENFERLAARDLDTCPEWRAVQGKRAALARQCATAASAPSDAPPSPETAPSVPIEPSASSAQAGGRGDAANSELPPNVAEDIAGPPRGEVISEAEAPDNRALVEAFIRRELKRTGKKINRTDIWSRFYDEATEFERWQRNDPRTTAKAREQFEGLLAMNPDSELDD